MDVVPQGVTVRACGRGFLGQKFPELILLIVVSILLLFAEPLAGNLGRP